MIQYGAAILVVALIAADGGAIWRLHTTAIADAENNLGRLNRVLEKQSAQALQDARLVLASVETDFASTDLRTAADFRRTAAGEEVRRRLARKIAGLPQIASLLLIDPTGLVINSSDGEAVGRLNFANHIDLAAWRDPPQTRLVVDRAATGAGDPTIYLARRLSAADGGVLGFAVATVRLDYFTKIYRGVDLGYRGAIALWNADGTLLARYPPAPPRGEAAALDRRLLAAIDPEGSVALAHASDAVAGEPVVVAASRLPTYPLITTTSLSIAAILSAWRIQTIVIGAIGTMLCLAVIATALLLRRHVVRAHRLLRDAVESISEGFVIFDANDRLVMCNEAYRRMYGEIADRIVPGTMFEQILRAGLAKGQIPDAEHCEEEWITERLRQHHQVDGIFEQRLSRDRWALASERRMSDGGTAGLRIDITALKKAQIALQESRRRLDEAERIARLGCSEYDLTTRQLTWSSETYRIFGLDPREPPPTGDDYLASVEASARDRLRAAWADLARGECPMGFEHWIVRPDGESRLIHREHEIIRDRNGHPVRVVSTLQDVTLQRAAEQRARELERLLIHSQKLEALGIMAGGLAHELNNILAPVLSLAQVALEDFPVDSRARGDLEMVVIASQRARDLVRQVLAFGRRQPLEKRSIDLGVTVRQSLRMMRATLPATIGLIERIDPVPPIQADADQLQQVIVNLVTNAAQAIGDRGGRIVVGLGYREGTTEQALGAVCLSVEDDGSGMDELVAQRIFEPFFTTREADRGSGLGLSVVHGIVTSHGGRIELRTAPNKGSVFSIVLPAAGRRETLDPVQSAA